MKKIFSFALIAAAAAAPVAAHADDTQSVHAVTDRAVEVDVKAGTMLYASNGYRLAPVYRVSSEGNPQVILNGKLVTVPASTLSNADGKVTTSLTKKDLGRSK